MSYKDRDFTFGSMSACDKDNDEDNECQEQEGSKD